MVFHLCIGNIPFIFKYIHESNLIWSHFRYKTQTQSLRSESATPSPSGSGSCDDDITTEPPSSFHPNCGGIMWAVSDMASVPKGSVLIDPQTLQPVVNRDGWVICQLTKTMCFSLY